MSNLTIETAPHTEPIERGTQVSDKPTFSFSRLSMFEQCPRQYYYKYIENRPYPSNGPMKFGKIFHRAIELIHEAGYLPEESAFLASEEAEGMPEGYSYTDLVRMIKKTLKRLTAGEYADVYSEIHLLQPIAEDIYLQGYLDRVVDDPTTNTTLIQDFKTSWAHNDRYQKQLALYGWLFRNMREGVVGDLVGQLVYPRLRNEDREFAFTDDDLEDARQWALDLATDILSREKTRDAFEMNVGSACEHCPFSALCSQDYINCDIPGDGTPANIEEAIKVGEFIALLEQQIKKMKSSYKNYIQASGGIEISGGKWEISQGQSNPSIPVPVLMAYAEEHELDPTYVLSADNKKVKEWLETDESGMLSAHAKWSTPRETLKFTASKKK
ncbi:PD-(D/E)XK nuclease family protein [Niallia taxi]|uniref:PD-(D/E)XK nuclease family protein n=1 Tax=Niallia taxi TaxID=2499688 RepID=UPI0015F48192|nr:PD-(D/E)XK nuclease family protein [Niallia taxi]